MTALQHKHTLVGVVLTGSKLAPFRSNAGRRRRCPSCCSPSRPSPAPGTRSPRTLRQGWPAWSRVSATWRWTTGTSDRGGLRGGTLEGTALPPSPPFVYSPPGRLRRGPPTGEKLKASSRLALSRTLLFTRYADVCTAPTSSLPPFTHTHTHNLWSDCTRVSQDETSEKPPPPRICF